MLALRNLAFLRQSCRAFSTTGMLSHRIAVIGALGNVGLPLTLLLKRLPIVTAVNMYDIVNVEGMGMDLGHCDTNSVIEAFTEPDIGKALRCAEVTVVCAGMPRKPGMQRDDVFNMNADIIKCLVPEIAKICPKTLLAIVTNPVNSLVPLAAECLKKENIYDPNRLFGVTTLDVSRARVFLADHFQTNTDAVKVPVIGGHSEKTILPILSQCKPTWKEEDECTDKFVQRLRVAGTEVVKAKAKHKGGSASVSTAHATAVFVNSLCKGLKNDGAATECTYVESSVTDASFFSTSVVLGKNGILKNEGLPGLSKYETEKLKELIPDLKKDIKKGVDYAHK